MSNRRPHEEPQAETDLEHASQHVVAEHLRRKEEGEPDDYYAYAQAVALIDIAASLRDIAFEPHFKRQVTRDRTIAVIDGVDTIVLQGAEVLRNAGVRPETLSKIIAFVDSVKPVLQTLMQIADAGQEGQAPDEDAELPLGGALSKEDLETLMRAAEGSAPPRADDGDDRKDRGGTADG